jgi:hypothetical protein
MKLKSMFILILLISCKKEVNNNKNLVNSYEKMERLIIDKGHIGTYENYRNMADRNMTNSLYTYSVIMAYKYKHIPAYHDCYVELLRLNEKDRYFNPSTLLKMNISQKEIIKFHLTNGAKIKDFACMSSLHYIYYYKLIENNNNIKFCDSLKNEILKIFPDYKVGIYQE